MSRLVSTALLAALSLSAHEVEPEHELSREQRDVFRILDDFDPLDTSKLPFVRIWAEAKNPLGLPINDLDLGHGFLVHSVGTRFGVRCLNLSTFESNRTDCVFFIPRKVKFIPVSLRKLAAEYISQPELACKEDMGFTMSLGTGRPYQVHALGVYLARACARRGHMRAVAAIWATLPNRQVLLQDLGRALSLRIHMDFADRGYTYRDLHSRLRLWLETFPGHLMIDSIAELERDLVKMLNQKVKRSPKGTRPTVAELIYDLRHEFDMPTEFGLFQETRIPSIGRASPTPSATLVTLRTLSVEEIPALIEAIDDLTLTRMVSCTSRYGGAVHSVRVRACALMLLRERSGLTFYKDPKTQYLEWIDSVLEHGEEATLVRYARTTGSLEPHTASHLLNHWPKRAGVVLAAIQSKEITPSLRAQLVDTLAGNKEPETIQFLTEEVELESGPEAVFAAVRALRDSGSLRGFEIALERFGRSPTSGDAHVLLYSPKAEHVKAVAALIDDAEIRGPVLSAVSAMLMRRLCGETSEFWPPNCVPILEAPDFNPLLEGMLGQILNYGADDADNLSFMLGDLRTDPLHASDAEQAAVLMACLWPSTYSFDSTASSYNRALNVLKTRRIFRARHNQPVAVIPKQPTVRGQTQALIRTLRAIRHGGRGTEQAVESLRDYGLGALPWAMDLVDDLPQAGAAWIQLKQILPSLANIVRTVEIDSGLQVLTIAQNKQLTSIRGATLNSDRIRHLIDAAMDIAPGEGGSVDLHVERSRGLGIVLRLRIRPFLQEAKSGTGLKVFIQGSSVLVFSPSNWISKLDHENREIDKAMASNAAHSFDLLIASSCR